MSNPEPVGSLAEEAARLFAALQSRLGEPADADESAGHETPHEHGEAGSTECRWCPLCQLARLATAATPDVREHLSQAALSLALAVKGLLEDADTTSRRATPLEKIDLTEE